MKTHIITAILCIVYFISNAQENKHYNFEYEGIKYRILSESEHTVETVSNDESPTSPTSNPYTFTAKTVTLPATVSHNGNIYTLKKIGTETFWRSNIKEIVLPNTVKEIDVEAFTCSNLETIKGIDNLQSIGSMAFGNTQISEFVFPDSIKSIGSLVFMLSHKLRRLEFPANDKYELGWGIFLNINPYEIKCGAFDPPSGGDFGYGSQKRIPKNTWIVVPKLSVDKYKNAEVWKNFEDKILPDDYKLDSIILFQSNGLFFSKIPDSDNLVAIVRPPKQYMKHPYGYSSGGTFNIPSSVKFNNKEYIVHSIGGFMDSEYEEIILPPTVKVIDRLAFIHSKIKRINIENITEIRQQAFHGSALEEIKIPENVSLSFDGTFYDCQNLNKVDLPSSMTRIYDGNIDDLETKLFCNCTNLTTLICRSEKPFDYEKPYSTNYDKVFEIETYDGDDYQHITPTVWVPKGSIDYYREKWSKYITDFRELEEASTSEIITNATIDIDRNSGSITIYDLDNACVSIASVSGQKLYSNPKTSGHLTITLPKGLYILIVDGGSSKFVI